MRVTLEGGQILEVEDDGQSVDAIVEALALASGGELRRGKRAQDLDYDRPRGKIAGITLVELDDDG